MDKRILAEFLKRPIAYQPVVAKAVGSVKLGILWSQLYYWSDKTTDPDGWIYKTRKDIENETALSRKEQETARRDGRNLGLIEEKLAGQPAKVHFKINMERMIELIGEYTEKNISGQIQLIKPEKQSSSIAYIKNVPEKDVYELAKKYSVTEKFVIDRADDVATYCEAKGKFYKNYKAALQNFIKSHLRDHPEERIRKNSFEEQKIEVEKERTPEEQERVNKQLDKIRKQLNNKFSIK